MDGRMLSITWRNDLDSSGSRLVCTEIVKFEIFFLFLLVFLRFFFIFFEFFKTEKNCVKIKFKIQVPKRDPVMVSIVYG